MKKLKFKKKMDRRRGDNKTRQAVEEALQKRDINDITESVNSLKETMEQGFKGVHERQDTTNGKVLKAGEDIIEIKRDFSFYKGGLAVIAIVILPLVFMVVKLMLERR